MTTAKNCELCHNLYISDEPEEKYCKKCRIQLDTDFKKIRDYLYDHHGANSIEVSNKTGISNENILIFMKEPRFRRK